MKSWGLFFITLGSLGIITYPIHMQKINLVMAAFFILIGIYVYRGMKK
ncbi:hypothetical protein [Oceanivirga miroungae]|uniref:Uncharacterized protein n=1 Tax=Oceanivirga miroungae TaxID=1130046 RepID=A0A6I8MCI9_9FUSO|nr:hypothetical protein [Oceanivirga miroungae]VWL85192.1 hypothetical protein OMES3154_00475 [Oceanivirga miroungae]